MKMFRQLTILAIGILILAQHATTRGADILQNLPHDALGFVVIKNLSATDAKAGQLLTTFNAQYPSPLIFLEAVTGIREGLDAQGDLLLAMLPAGENSNTEPQFCVWLPVADYDRILTLLEATRGVSISSVRVADEDLIVARQGNWAVLTDPDARPRLEQILQAGSNPPAAVTAWKGWIDKNDVAIVLLQPGIEQVLAWSARVPKPNDRDAEEPEDDLFGRLEIPADADPFVAPEAAANPLYVPIRREVHKWIVRAPKVKGLIEHSEAIGAAARLDAAGNAVASARLMSRNRQAWNVASTAEVSLPPALYEQGGYILNGAGRLPRELISAIASLHARRMLDDLKKNDRIKLDGMLAAEFEKAVVIAASDIAAWSIVHQPGDLETGIHNNSFFVLRVPSTKSFLEHAAEAMDRWNTMHRESDNETKYIFDIEETKIGDRVATQYLLDVGVTGGMPALPEMRQIMEKFFGPGGKMRVWLVPIDEQMALLAAGTPEQVAAALRALDRREAIDWTKPEFAAANKLVPETVDWRVFFSPRGYYAWKRRETEAMMGGVPVLGAKPAKDFPVSPPIVFFGNARDNELEVNAAATADAITSAAKYFRK